MYYSDFLIYVISTNGTTPWMGGGRVVPGAATVELRREQQPGNLFIKDRFCFELLNIRFLPSVEMTVF